MMARGRIQQDTVPAPGPPLGPSTMFGSNILPLDADLLLLHNFLSVIESLLGVENSEFLYRS